jgi:hypothetical protein
MKTPTEQRICATCDKQFDRPVNMPNMQQCYACWSEETDAVFGVPEPFYRSGFFWVLLIVVLLVASTI